MDPIQVNGGLTITISSGPDGVWLTEDSPRGVHWHQLTAEQAGALANQLSQARLEYLERPENLQGIFDASKENRP